MGIEAKATVETGAGEKKNAVIKLAKNPVSL